jgi:protease PrsW
MTDWVPLGFSILLSFSASLLFAAVIFWLDRYEKEPFVLLGAVFFWGAIFAAGLAYIVNTSLAQVIFDVSGSSSETDTIIRQLVAPLLEESVKSAALLGIFFYFYAEFDSILDGIIYAAVTALGFSAAENAYYLFVHGYLLNGWPGIFSMAFSRLVMVGWQHPFFTAFFGIGLAIARQKRSRLARIAIPLLGWLAAVFVHVLHNALNSYLGMFGLSILTVLLDWSGWLVMLGFIFWCIQREQEWLALYLKEEVDFGIITLHQYHTACSALRQDWARLRALKTGCYQQTTRLFQVCGEIAHKKRQKALFGEEHGNTNVIETLRSELGYLSPFVSLV